MRAKQKTPVRAQVDRAVPCSMLRMSAKPSGFSIARRSGRSTKKKNALFERFEIKRNDGCSDCSGFNRLKLRVENSILVESPMTYAILVEKTRSGQLPAGFYYAHVPALGLTTHGHGIEGARAAAEDLIKLWLAEKKAAGEAIDLPSEFFFSTVDISESALQSA